MSAIIKPISDRYPYSIVVVFKQQRLIKAWLLHKSAVHISSTHNWHSIDNLQICKYVKPLKALSFQHSFYLFKIIHFKCLLSLHIMMSTTKKSVNFKSLFRLLKQHTFPWQSVRPKFCPSSQAFGWLLKLVWVWLCLPRAYRGIEDLLTWIRLVFITSQSICIIPTSSSRGIMDSERKSEVRYGKTGFNACA